MGLTNYLRERNRKRVNAAIAAAPRVLKELFPDNRERFELEPDPWETYFTEGERQRIELRWKRKQEWRAQHGRCNAGGG